MKLIIVILLALFLFNQGCDKDKLSKTDWNLGCINHLYSDLDRPVDEEIEKDLTKQEISVKNGIQDESPVLFYAKIGKLVGKDQAVLVLDYYDEDANVLGIGIREIISDDIILEERYPLYLQKQIGGDAVYSDIIYVNERTHNQIKNEIAWSLYMRSEDRFSMNRKYPSIWCSFSSDTEVFIYDKDRNVSTFVNVELLDSVTENNETGS